METCAWTATFRRGLLPGAYAVDVLNTWLRGDEEPKTPHYDAVRVQRGRGWRGEPFDWQNAAGGDLDADAADDGPVGDLALGRGGVAAHRGGPDDAADADDTTAWNSGAVETDASLSLH